MKKIFISHSSFEEKFVEKLENALENTFCCEVFAFKESLEFGDEWFEKIRKELEEANLHIILLSPVSVRKPWTYFEAGGTTWIKKTKPIPMMLCLSENKISASNPLSKLWHGNFFKEKDIKELFKLIKKEIPLHDGGGKKMEDKFVENIIDAVGDEYKILDAFRKIMEKDVRKEQNIFSLHKRGIAPVPVILYEAFGEDVLKEKLNIEVKDDHNGNFKISTYDSPAKLGEMVKCFEDLSRQGYIERIDTPLEGFLKKTIRKAKEKADFPAEVPVILFKEEKTLRKINLEKDPLAGLKQYPIADENDLVVFLQTKEIIRKILTVANANSGFSPARIWKSIIDFTMGWWEEYKDYFSNSDQSKIKVLNIDFHNSGDLIMGSFHSLLWNTHYKELGDFLRGWYKISV